MENQYSIYTNKDGRTRIYDRLTKKVTSYPRFVIEQNIGRKLEEYEDVHHVDGNPLHNSLENLQVISHGEHQKQHMPPKYTDKQQICPCCGKEFIWTAIQQKRRKMEEKRHPDRSGPYCSKSCAGKGLRSRSI